jgi:hypothetical protein
MKVVKPVKNDQKLADQAKEAGRVREEKIAKILIETMQKKRAKTS